MFARKTFISALLCLASLACTAQENYTIYPIPQSQKVSAEKASFTSVVNIVASKNIDKITLERAKEVITAAGLTAQVVQKPSSKRSNIYLGVNRPMDNIRNLFVKLRLPDEVFRKQEKFDKHVLSLYRVGKCANVMILGETTEAAFYGLASLEQIFDRGTQNLSCVEIQDFADIQYRGIIEGYYGVPYNEDVTKQLFRFMARYKMNSYMYGAKSDPYHTQKWDEPYPDSISAEQKAIGYLSKGMMAHIAASAKQNKVNFIWAIHPGSAFTENKENKVIERIMNKFQKMYDLGIRQFGIFVDDVGVPQDSISLALNAKRLTEAQQAVEERWNKHYTNPADTVKPIHFVPQLYAYSWFNDTVCQKFFSALSHTSKKAVVYITGAKVWSVPNSHDLEVVTKSFGRPLAWWWNYPCNDNDMSKLFVRDTYTNFADEKWIDNDAKLESTLTGANALISNPMQQGMASCFALFGVADYAWNHSGFNNERNYQAAQKAVVGQQRVKAFDHVSQYLRYYDAEPLKSLMEKYAANGDEQPLIREMELLMGDCNSIMAMQYSENKTDSIFYSDIHPWVAKVSDMAYYGRQLLQLTRANKQGQPISKAEVQKLAFQIRQLDANPNYKFSVLNGMGNDIKLSYIGAEPAQKGLRPLLSNLVERLEKQVMER